MAFYRTYQCASCAGKFRFFHHPEDLPPPEKCPLCGADTGEIVPSFIPQAPAIQGVVGIAADQVYRSMEAASAARAEEMAEIGGGSAADYAHTKITDLKDNTHEGEISAVMPSANVVRGFMQEHGNRAPIGNQHAAVAMQYAAQAHTGYMPYAGERSRQVVAGNRREGDPVSSMHAAMAARMARQGQMNG